jgi:hypothetical protein
MYVVVDKEYLFLLQLSAVLLFVANMVLLLVSTLSFPMGNKENRWQKACQEKTEMCFMKNMAEYVPS